MKGVFMYRYPQSRNYIPQNVNMTQYRNDDDDRLLGGFAFPFLLGGVTGAAIAPAFWRPNYGYNYYQPYYNPYYRPYPYYR